MSYTSKTMNEFERGLRMKMRDMLALCTERENDLFCRMYNSKKKFAHPVDAIPFDKLDWAFSQIEKTLAKK